MRYLEQLQQQTTTIERRKREAEKVAHDHGHRLGKWKEDVGSEGISSFYARCLNNHCRATAVMGAATYGIWLGTAFLPHPRAQCPFLRQTSYGGQGH